MLKTKAIITDLLLSCLIFSFVVSGCSPEQAAGVQETGKRSQDQPDSEYLSGTDPENCLLCGPSSQTLLPLYRSQKNLGIISLNTFDICPVEINPYDDQGNPIEKPADSTSMTTSSHEENGTFIQIYPNTNRGYANVNLSFKDDETLDMDKAAANLCTECLNTVLNETWSSSPYGVGVIDFDTLQVRLLAENITAFTFGDYYISCSHREKTAKEDSVEMDLLIFYCPERYEDT